jgi:hypothetical protein
MKGRVQTIELSTEFFVIKGDPFWLLQELLVPAIDIQFLFN